jgi:UPF0755 protein
MKTLRIVSVGLLAVLVLAGVAALVLYRGPEQSFQGYAGSEQFVELASGSSPRAIGDHLVQAGVVRDALTFRLAVWRLGVSRQLKAGEYRFAGPATALEVVRRIAHGDVYVRPVTFPEGLTIEDMARIYEERGLGTAAEFRHAAANGALVDDLDPLARDLEGYLFPETYSLTRHATAADLVRMMVRRFRQVFAPLAAEAAASGRSVREIVTLASMVEKETARPEERPTVAGVYVNRLRIRMGLQCDPTVIYGLRKAGRYDGNLTHANLASDTPYNTYVHAGLPPGPIASPGRASLEASVRPADLEFLYFVSRNDGSHEFSRTLDEHNRNVARYQKGYLRGRR